MCILYSLLIVIVLLTIFVLSAYAMEYSHPFLRGSGLGRMALDGLLRNWMVILALVVPIAAGEYYVRFMNKCD